MSPFYSNWQIKNLPHWAADSAISRVSEATEVIDQGQQHHTHDEANTDLHAPCLYTLGQGPPANPLDEVEDQMTTVEHRDRQQIQNPQAYAQVRL